MNISCFSYSISDLGHNVFNVVSKERVKVDSEYCTENVNIEIDDPILVTRYCLAHMRNEIHNGLKV